MLNHEGIFRDMGVVSLRHGCRDWTRDMGVRDASGVTPRRMRRDWFLTLGNLVKPQEPNPRPRMG